MNPVVQQHPEGCALTCAAMLSGSSYPDEAAVAAGMGIHAGDKRLYDSTAPMRRLFARLDVRLERDETPFTGWHVLPNRALLATKWHPEAGGAWWHWVVFLRGGDESVVLDPNAGLASIRRRDFSAIQPKWLVEIPTAQHTTTERLRGVQHHRPRGSSGV